MNLLLHLDEWTYYQNSIFCEYRPFDINGINPLEKKNWITLYGRLVVRMNTTDIPPKFVFILFIVQFGQKDYTQVWVNSPTEI